MGKAQEYDKQHKDGVKEGTASCTISKHNSSNGSDTSLF